MLAIRERREARARRKKHEKQQELGKTKALRCQLSNTLQEHIENGNAATKNRFQTLQLTKSNIDDVQRYQAFVQHLRLERASDQRELNRVDNVIEGMTKEKKCADVDHTRALKDVEKTKLLLTNIGTVEPDEEGE